MTTENFVPDEATLARFGALPDNEPVVMLNLLEFVDGGEARYAEYGRTALPQIQERGGQILYAGGSIFDDPGAGHWDQLILVQHPSRASFADMMAAPEYQRGLPHRAAALKRTELHAFKQSKEPGVLPLGPVPVEGGDEIFMLNLMRFKPNGGRDEYRQYAEVSVPLIQGCGGSLPLVLDAELPLVGEETWEEFYLVRYPNLRALKEMVATEAWKTANAHRQRGLDLTWSFGTQPAS